MDLLLNLETAQYRTQGHTETLPESVRLGIKSPASETGLYPAQHRLRFYPDGSSTAARITLSRDGQGYELVMDWLIGRVRISETTVNAP